MSDPEGFEALVNVASDKAVFVNGVLARVGGGAFLRRAAGALSQRGELAKHTFSEVGKALRIRSSE